MFLLVLFAVALASVPAAGGHLGRLAGIRFRGVPFVVAALALQIVIIEIVPQNGSWLHDTVHLSTYGLTGCFLFFNRRVPGLLVAGAGGALNLTAIAANGGVMPARLEALETAGLAHGTGDFENSTVVADAHLAFLGDVFAIPKGVPLANVFSVGDVLLIVGITIGLHVICRSKLAPKARRRVDIAAFELVEASTGTGTATALARVAGDWPEDVVALHVEAGERRRRLTPLPGTGPALGFGVQAGLLTRAPAFALELRSGRTVPLPDPARRRLA